MYPNYPSNLQFINLDKLILANYDIIYQIDAGYNIKNISNFKSKHQLHFQKFTSRTNHFNLMLVDSIFPLIISDICLLSLIYNHKTFEKYILSSEKLGINYFFNNPNYYLKKITDFIHLLLYTEKENDKLYKEKINPYKIYYYKDEKGNIQFYDYYKYKKLIDFLIGKIIIKIDINKSEIIEDKLKLSSQINVLISSKKDH